MKFDKYITINTINCSDLIIIKSLELFSNKIMMNYAFLFSTYELFEDKKENFYEFRKNIFKQIGISFDKYIIENYFFNLDNTIILHRYKNSKNNNKDYYGTSNSFHCESLVLKDNNSTKLYIDRSQALQSEICSFKEFFVTNNIFFENEYYLINLNEYHIINFEYLLSYFCKVSNYQKLFLDLKLYEDNKSDINRILELTHGLKRCYVGGYNIILNIFYLNDIYYSNYMELINSLNNLFNILIITYSKHTFDKKRLLKIKNETETEINKLFTYIKEILNMNIYKKIKNAISNSIAEELFKDINELSPDDNLYLLGLDSLNSIRLIIGLEEEFDIILRDEDISTENLKSIDSLEIMVKKYLIGE